MNDQKPIRALEELGASLEAAERQAGSNRPSKVKIAAGCAVLLVVLSFTPPGRVVAREIGDLVGIGEESSVQHAANEADSIVLAAGEAPGGTPYEIAAFTKFAVSPGDRPGDVEINESRLDGELCIDMDLPGGQSEDEGPGVCFTTDNFQDQVERESFVASAEFAPRQLQPGAEMVVSGHASQAVDSVEVSYERDGEAEEAPVELARVTEEQAEVIGSPRVGAAFFAFLPSGVLQEDPAQPGVLTQDEVRRVISTIEVTALDSNGNVRRTGGLYERAGDVLFISLDHAPERFSNTPTREEVLKACIDRLREGGDEDGGETSKIEISCEVEPAKP